MERSMHTLRFRVFPALAIVLTASADKRRWYEYQVFSALLHHLNATLSAASYIKAACSATRLHVLARPLGKGSEAAGNEVSRCGDGGLRVRTEIGMRLEVLVHLAQLPGAGEAAVKDLRRYTY